MAARRTEACQLRPGELSVPMGRAVLEAPVWPNELRGFAEHSDLCVHAVLPSDRARWHGVFVAIRILAGRTAHLRVHAHPARGGFSMDPAVLRVSRTRRHRELLAAIQRDAAAAGVELMPGQVLIDSSRRTRSALRLPPPTDHAIAWGVISIAWFPLTEPHPASHPRAGGHATATGGRGHA